jgi:hypothetical protein
MRCLVLSGPEPIERQPGHLTVDALAHVPASALLLEPRIEIGSSPVVALDGEGMITRPERLPLLSATEELDEINGDLGAKIPPRLAPHEPWITGHVHPSRCST